MYFLCYINLAFCALSKIRGESNFRQFDNNRYHPTQTILKQKLMIFSFQNMHYKCTIWSYSDISLALMFLISYLEFGNFCRFQQVPTKKYVTFCVLEVQYDIFKILLSSKYISRRPEKREMRNDKFYYNITENYFRLCLKYSFC